MRKFLLIAVTMVCVGCSSITATDRRVIQQNQLNAQAMNEKVQSYEWTLTSPGGETFTTQLPDAVKRWFAAEAKTWDAMVRWATGTPSTPTTQPGE